MAPNHARISVMFFGVGKDMMESINSFVGLIPVSVTRNPRKSSSRLPN